MDIDNDNKSAAIGKETVLQNLSSMCAGTANKMIKVISDLYSDEYSSLHNVEFKRFQCRPSKNESNCFYEVLGIKLFYNNDDTRIDDISRMLTRGIPVSRLEDFFLNLSEALVEYTNTLSDFDKEGEEVKELRDSIVVQLKKMNPGINAFLTGLDIPYVNHQVNASDKEDLRKHQIEDFKKELKAKYEPKAEQELKEFIDALGYPNDGDTQQEQWSVRLSFIKKKQN